jgi:hypothetical protein
VATLLVVALGIVGLPSADSPQPRKPQGQRASKAQSPPAASSLAESQRQLLAARARHDRALAMQPGLNLSVNRARQRALQEIPSNEQFLEAAKERDTAWRDHETRRKQVIEQLKDRPDYQAALRESERASDRLRALPDDTSISDEERRARASEYALQLRRPGEMEKEALQSDAELWQRKQDWTLAEARLESVRQSLQQGIDSTPGVQQALEAQRQNTEELAQARQQLETRSQEYTAAQGRALSGPQRNRNQNQKQASRNTHTNRPPRAKAPPKE